VVLLEQQHFTEEISIGSIHIEQSSNVVSILFVSFNVLINDLLNLLFLMLVELFLIQVELHFDTLQRFTIGYTKFSYIHINKPIDIPKMNGPITINIKAHPLFESLL
tara:strand:+ start:751 stop:1071 length:321 start_codon:yes stop_codon:yes gene_type:complete